MADSIVFPSHGEIVSTILSLVLQDTTPEGTPSGMMTVVAEVENVLDDIALRVEGMDWRRLFIIHRLHAATKCPIPMRDFERNLLGDYPI